MKIESESVWRLPSDGRLRLRWTSEETYTTLEVGTQHIRLEDDELRAFKAALSVRLGDDDDGLRPGERVLVFNAFKSTEPVEALYLETLRATTQHIRLEDGMRLEALARIQVDGRTHVVRRSWVERVELNLEDIARLCDLAQQVADALEASKHLDQTELVEVQLLQHLEKVRPLLSRKIKDDGP